MEKGNLKGEQKFGSKSVKVDLQVLFFEEDNSNFEIFFAPSPNTSTPKKSR